MAGFGRWILLGHFLWSLASHLGQAWGFACDPSTGQLDCVAEGITETVVVGSESTLSVSNCLLFRCPSISVIGGSLELRNVTFQGPRSTAIRMANGARMTASNVAFVGPISGGTVPECAGIQANGSFIEMEMSC